MERVYRVTSLQRSGGKKYWEPVSNTFVYKKMPTIEYSKYSDALTEYRNAISAIEDNYTCSVSLEERVKDGSAWHKLKERKFAKDDLPPLAASNEIERVGDIMQLLSDRIMVIAGLPNLSNKVREEVEIMSKQLDGLIFSSIRLRYKVFEDLKDGENL